MRPRVLQILLFDAHGGTEMMVATLLERHDRELVEMELATLAGSAGPVARRAASAGIRVRVLGERGLPVAFVRLARLLATERYDVVNAYGFKATFATRFLARLTSPRTRVVSGVRGLLVTDVRNPDGPKARFATRVERLVSPLVDVYDANSQGALEVLARAGIPREKLRYIPNGIHAADWPVRNGHGPGEPPTLACVARFVPLKRHTDVLRAVRKLIDEHDLRLRLLLVGHGPLLGEVRAEVRQLGLADHVDIRENVDADGVRELLGRADAFVLASTCEGMAGSVMEAMAAGLPVVGTDVNGIADLVVDGETGLLVAPCDVDGLAAALGRVLGDPSLARRMGQAGRRRVELRFSVEAMLRAKVALYRELAAA